MLGFAVTEVALFLLVLKQPVTLLLHGIWLQMLLISLEDNCLTFLGYYRAMVPKIYPAQGKFFFLIFFSNTCVCVCIWSAFGLPPDLLEGVTCPHQHSVPGMCAISACCVRDG